MALLLLLLSNAVLAGAALLLLFEENDSTAVSSSSSPDRPGLATGSQVTVFFATQKGRSRRFAERLASALRSAGHSASVVDVAGYDVDQLNTLTTAVFILATYEGGTPPPGTEDFFVQLFDAVEDFRVSKASLQQLRYSVFGCGNSEYPEKNFNAAARRTDRALRTLGAVRVARRSDGDEFDNRLDEQFEHWMVKVLPALLAPPKVSTIPPAASVAQTAVGRAAETPADEWESEEEGGGGHGMEGLVDLEDLGTRLVGSKGGSKGGTGLLDTSEPKKMVSNSLRKALTKQGYRVVGSHSGVKLCRWTKAMLRGRGGCYKHTFYGIVSYQCMEATPSLACANKCVFCWRHHDNPVGTSFRWQVDDPQKLLDGFESGHKSMIKQMRGVPGVIPERFEEAMSRVRHCALSLVGEPIIYPRINEFLDGLHTRGVSSFMVTNAQFPEQMDTLNPCTQLYISIDAPTKDQLQAVDRPLFEDFWERFLECVQMLREKRQRTVFRLTLVNEWNTSELDEYAKLVTRGAPDFIEIKGVTYCGESKASPLTIKHCPFHHEVRRYCERLVEAIGGEYAGQYAIASEHAHSNCMLVARKDLFLKNGSWHTWIDFERFTKLYETFRRDGTPFGSEDYLMETPEWAQYNPEAADGGFDPNETRVKGKGGKLTAEAGC